MLEQVGPHGLRAGIAAPCASHGAGDEEQPDTRHDEQARDEIEFVRPDLDAEHVEAAVGEIDQHRLIGRIGSTLPADPRRDVIDRQRDDHDQPFEPAERTVDPLVVHELALFVEPLWQFFARRFVRLVSESSRSRFGNRARYGIVGLGDPVLDDDRPVAVAAGIAVLRVAHRPLPRDPRRPQPSLRLPRANAHRPRAS